MSTSIEIFKTDVNSYAMAGQISHALRTADPTCLVSFDLEDCDRILRVEGEQVDCLFIMSLVEAHGHRCDAL